MQAELLYYEVEECPWYWLPDFFLFICYNYKEKHWCREITTAMPLHAQMMKMLSVSTASPQVTSNRQASWERLGGIGSMENISLTKKLLEMYTVVFQRSKATCMKCSSVLCQEYERERCLDISPSLPESKVFVESPHRVWNFHRIRRAVLRSFL